MSWINKLIIVFSAGFTVILLYEIISRIKEKITKKKRYVYFGKNFIKEAFSGKSIKELRTLKDKQKALYHLKRALQLNPDQSTAVVLKKRIMELENK